MKIDLPWYRAAKFAIVGFEEPVTPPAPVVEPPVVEPPVVEPPADDKKVYTAEEIAGLQSALDKERKDRKAYEKELSGYRKAQQAAEDKDKTEVQRLSDEDARKATKLEKLAAGFRTAKVESAVLEAARAAKFTDPTDALRPEVLSIIGVEQDEEDPTQVTVDDATVTAAIKALAKSKPHYLGTQKPPPVISGSKFGGPGGGSQVTEEQKLIASFPALARRG